MNKRFSKIYRKVGGLEVHAADFSDAEWLNLKHTYTVGDFIMSCCSEAAIPKTSENGLQFFAHLSDECGNAPETVWHKTAKTMILDFCVQRGIFCKTEMPDVDKLKWRADIYIEYNSRKIAIEIQRSYQHRDEFFHRQNRYKDSGVECFWLLRQDVYRTLVSTEQKHRIRVEHDGKLPKDMAVCRPELPIAFLEIEPEICVKGAGLFKTSFDKWVMSILENRFIFDGRIWTISP